jgi:sulfatase maturation enzyme AslB (radical SAM superfamily)
MPIGDVAVADDGNNSDVVMKENEEAISEFAEELPVTDQQEFTWPEVIEEIKEEATSIMQNANEGEFVFNGAEAVLQNETMNESFEDSFEGSFEDSFENVSFDEPLQDKGNIIIDDSAPQADISQPEQHFVSEQPIFGEFTEPAERVHIQPEQPASQPQPASVQQQRQAQPQQPMKQRMTFDTARSGKAYNKSEIESIIKS